MTRRESPGYVPAVAADHDRYAGLLDGLRDVDRVADMRVLPLVRGMCGLAWRQHPGDDFEMVRQRGQPDFGLRETVPVGLPLVAFPSRPDTQLHPPAANRIQGRDRLGRQRRISEPGADHDVAEPHSGGETSQRRQRAEGLERDLVRRPRNGMEVVEQPDGLKAQSLRLMRHRDGAAPGIDRIPPVVLALPTLRHDDTNLHRKCSLTRPLYSAAALQSAARCWAGFRNAPRSP